MSSGRSRHQSGGAEEWTARGKARRRQVRILDRRTENHPCKHTYKTHSLSQFYHWERAERFTIDYDMDICFALERDRNRALKRLPCVFTVCIASLVRCMVRERLAYADLVSHWMWRQSLGSLS